MCPCELPASSFQLPASGFQLFCAPLRDGLLLCTLPCTLRARRLLRGLRYLGAFGALRALHLQCARDDLLEHRPGFAALGRAVRDPDLGIAVGEDVGEIPFALDAEWREGRDVHVARPVVAVLDEEPRAAIARSGAPARVAPAGADEHPRALQLVAVERELQVALLERGVDVFGFGSPRALIP